MQSQSSKNLLTSPVLIVLAMGLSSAATVASIEWTLLPYLRHIRLESPKGLSLYLTTVPITLLPPLVLNPLIGYAADYVGTKPVLILGAFTMACGVSILILCRVSHLLFLFGYSLYAIYPALCSLRYAVLAELVPTEGRTTVIAWHALAWPLAGLISPLLWLAAQSISEHFNIDRFSLLYGGQLLILLIISIVIMLTLPGRQTSNEAQDTQDETALKETITQAYDATDNNRHTTPKKQSGRTWRTKGCILLLSVMMVGARFTYNMVTLAFQPVMVDRFHTDDHTMGIVYTILGVVAVFPPIAVARLADKLSDRELVKIGLFFKSIGALIYIPIFGALQRWQVILGYALVGNGSSFFTAACFSLITKTYKSNESAKPLGYIWGLSLGIPGIVQVLFKEHMAGIFGELIFGIFALPTFLSLLLVYHPTMWGLMCNEFVVARNACLTKTSK